jgi:hypothetical protein
MNEPCPCMEMPCLCDLCGMWFDLLDGKGCDLCNVVFCKDCVDEDHRCLRCADMED